MNTPSRLIMALTAICCLAACGGGGDKGGDQPAADAAMASSVNTTPARDAAPASSSLDWPPPVESDPSDGCDSQPLTGSHATYDVGPGKTYAELSDLAWTAMQAGDVVNVFYRATPYAAKIGLRVRGTAAAPFYLHGVSDPATCAKPVLTGVGAKHSADQKSNRFHENIETLGLITIWRGASDDDSTYKPGWITIDNLRMTNVDATHSFAAYDGTSKPYSVFSAPIYAVRVDHLYVRDCEIDHSALAVFVNTRGQNAIDFSEDIRLIRNRMHDNGVVGSDTIHNVYVQARRALYEGNDLAQLRVGAIGSTLKDRSSGTVVRFNRIAANARAIDLVETEEEDVSKVQIDPLYPHAWVYGNLIVNDFDSPNGASVNMVHFGYDNTLARARTGTLFYYGNTLVEAGPQSKAWYAQAFQVSELTPVAKVSAWNNIFANLGTVEFRFMGQAGELTLLGGNSLPPNWVADYPGQSGSVTTTGSTMLALANPGLASNYALTSGSAAMGAARSVSPSFPSGVVTENLKLSHQFDLVKGVGVKARHTQGNLGAFE